jgi:hypothetical protein
VRSQVEDALDKARISADAREFALREELEEKMVEIAQFRPRAEELARLQEQPAQLKSERPHGSARRSVTTAELGHTRQPRQRLPEQKQEATPAIDSTEKTIQNLLKSIDERMNQTQEDPRVAVQESATPAVRKFAIGIPPAVTQLSGSSVPKESPAVEPLPAVKDEWQEFAASLAALRSRQK